MLHIQGFLKLGLLQEIEEILLHAGLGEQKWKDGKYTAVEKCYLYHMLVPQVRNENSVTVTVE